MTDAPTITATPTDHRAHRAVAPAAITSVAASVALTAFGVRGVAGEPYQWGEFYIVVGVIALGAAVVFGWLVPRGLRAEEPGRIGLTLSLLGLLFVPLYVGLPPVLGTGGVLLGLVGHHSGRRSWTSAAAIVVGVLAVLAHVGIYLGDWLNTSGTI